MSKSLEAWQWWKAKKGDVADLVNDSIRDIVLRNSRDRRNELAALRSLYLDIPDPEGYKQFDIQRKERSPYHLIQGAVDSTHAQITTQRPRPLVVTIGGNGPLQRRAKLLQRWLDGEYERLEVFAKMSRCCLDALIFGTGLLKVGTHDNKNTLERVWCGDLWVDPREERFDAVRTLYQIHAIDRDLLRELYPKSHESIKAIRNPAPKDDVIFPDLQVHGFESPDLVTVIEAWRLPNTKSSPGRHVMITEGGSLVDREWEHDRFPFAKMRWAEVPMRFWGQGMVERGVGIQCDLNETCGIVRDAFETFVPKVVVSEAAGVDEEKLNDENGGIIYVTGSVQDAMQVFSPTVNPIVMQHEQSLAARAYQVLGVSQLGAGAVKPEGIDSGKGMQVYNDTTSGRFNPQGQRYEGLSIDVANLLLQNADDIAKQSPSAAQRVYGGKHSLEIVDYKDAQMKGENAIYEIRVFPVSGLSNSVSARMDEVRRLQALKPNMDPDQVDELIDIPDIERFRDLETAGRDLVNRAIDRCLDGEDVPASEYWPKEYAIRRVAQAIQLAEYQNEDPDGIAKLRNMHAMIIDLGMPPQGAEMMDPAMADPAMAAVSPAGPAPEGMMPPEPPVGGGVIQ